MIGENVAAIEAVLANLLALSGLDGEARQQRNVRLPAAVAEVVRQLRGSARARKVAVRVAADLPEVEVNAAAVELCLTNYLSNAIKYADSAKEDRWVEIRGRLVPRPAGDGALELVVEVRDNGLGVPIEERYHLFERFYRTREAVVTGVEGTGLGLSIVRETVETLGGRAWIEPSEELGTTFAFALPFRRANDLRETDGADLSTSRPADPSSR
jgi:signal transduction histidine kinase